MHIDTDKYKNILKKVVFPIMVTLCVTFAGVVYFVTDSGKKSEESENFTFADETSQDIVSSDVQDMNNTDEDIYVYVCGCVNAPGVVCLKKESRIYEVIELVGGFSENADINAINQAEFVKDGQKIYIPAVGETVNSVGDSGSKGLININTAGVSELTSLPGIGESKARAIIDYRDNNGPFSDISEIMNISGIKNNAFDKIKAYITI